jgi:hypothetical protein
MHDFFHVPDDRKKLADPCVIVMVDGTYSARSFKYGIRVAGRFRTRDDALSALRDEVLKLHGAEAFDHSMSVNKDRS